MLTSLVAQMVKHLSTMRETLFQSLGQEYLLEKEMVTHSSILAWKIPWMEKPGRLQSIGSQRVKHDRATSFFPVLEQADFPFFPPEYNQRYRETGHVWWVGWIGINIIKMFFKRAS